MAEILSNRRVAELGVLHDADRYERESFGTRDDLGDNLDASVRKLRAMKGEQLRTEIERLAKIYRGYANAGVVDSSIDLKVNGELADDLEAALRDTK